MASTAVPCPVLKLAASDDILTLASGTQTLVFDAASGKKLPSSTTTVDEKVTSNGAQLKAKSCRLVATGYAPVKVGGDAKEDTIDVQPVVASITEDKMLRLVQADTGVVFYERTLIKKASYLTIEEAGTVIVSDKNGDVFAYPFVNDAEPSTSSQPPKPRPDPVALAGDPSLNPDATLLVGHVSIVTGHAYTKDKRYLITIDRDEHVRLNRSPATHIIEKFVWGHKDFVSTITPSEIDDDVIHTAGGDPFILTSRISTGERLSALPIAEIVKANRTVRAPLRKVKRRVNGQKVPDVQNEADTGDSKTVRDLPLRGLSEEEWTSTPESWGLPEGEGICVGKVQSVGEHLVFFSEGTSAIHSVPAIALSSQETATPESVKTFQTPCPILDFCQLPSQTLGTQRLLLAMDPAWRHRIDGGNSWFPPKIVVVSRASKKKAASASATASGQDGTETKTEETSATTVVKPLEFAEDDVEEMLRDVFIVVEIGKDGEFTDVTTAHREYVEGIQSALQRVDVNVASQLPAYGNLAFLPKWASPEGDDDEITPETIEELQAKAASTKKGANAKRQIGRLKAQGIAVEVPRTEEQKMKRAEANRERKKRKKEQTKGAGRGGAGKPSSEGPAVGQGETSGEPDSVPEVVASMEIDTPADA